MTILILRTYKIFMLFGNDLIDYKKVKNNIRFLKNE